MPAPSYDSTPYPPADRLEAALAALGITPGGSVDAPALAALGVYPGGWKEETISHLVGAWTVGGGTWTFVAGVISQTNATADTALMYTATPFPSIEYVMQADVLVPTGQDGGTVATAAIAAGNDNSSGPNVISDLLGEGGKIVATAAGNPGSFAAFTMVDGSTGAFDPVALTMAQAEWHTFRVAAGNMRTAIWLDDAFVMENAKGTGGNQFAYTFGIGAIGLIQFRNIRLWTRALPT